MPQQLVEFFARGKHILSQKNTLFTRCLQVTCLQCLQADMRLVICTWDLQVGLL